MVKFISAKSKNKSLKQSLKHLNDVYYIFYNINNDKDVINEKLKNYILQDTIYTEKEIQEAKEIYAIHRNETISD